MGLMAINCYNPCSRTIISPNIVRRVIRQHHSEVHRNNNVMTEIISQKTEPLLIVTDLDGTMLNHEDYRFDEAVPALERAHAAGIPVILNTSKTRAELLQLREALGNTDPFIIENGSALCIPEQHMHLEGTTTEITEGYVELPLGVGVAEIRDLLTQLKQKYRFETFSDWTQEELQKQTGLSAEAAPLALKRRYSEAVLWQDSDEKRRKFLAELADHDLHGLQGGRFLSILGAETNKGAALERLKLLYRPVFGDTPVVIALGDSDNDIAMLEAADIAVLIANRARPAPEISAPEVIYSERTGAQGWNDVVQKLLDRYGAP